MTDFALTERPLPEKLRCLAKAIQDGKCDLESVVILLEMMAIHEEGKRQPYGVPHI